MLDPKLCVTKPTASYTALSWKIFEWLTTPSLVIPPLMIMIILPWFLRRFRWRRQVSGLGALLLVAYLGALSPTMMKLGDRGLSHFVPSDSGTPADAIVVLGRGAGMRAQRVSVAARLWNEQRAPLIFASGWGDAEEIAQMLAKKGVPATAIDGEPCSRTTEENAQYTAAILQPRHVQRILLVTDPPHMLRSVLTFRSLGFQVIPHLNPLPTHLNPKAKAFLIFREYVGLVSYGLWGRFLPREPSAADLNPTAIEVPNPAQATPALAPASS